MEQDINSIPEELSTASQLPYNSPNRNNSSNILFLTNPNQLLRELELKYRGQIENSNGELITIGVPLMNDDGINSILSIVMSVVNQVTIMSNISKEDLKSIIEFLSDSIIIDLMLNRQKYAMSYDSRRKILSITISLILMTLKRCVDNGERMFWKSSMMEFRSVVDGSNQQGKSNTNLLSTLFNKK